MRARSPSTPHHLIHTADGTPSVNPLSPAPKDSILALWPMRKQHRSESRGEESNGPRSDLPSGGRFCLGSRPVPDELGVAIVRGLEFAGVPLLVGLRPIQVCLSRVSRLVWEPVGAALTCCSLFDSSRYSLCMSLEASMVLSPLKSPEAHLSWTNNATALRPLLGFRSSCIGR